MFSFCHLASRLRMHGSRAWSWIDGQACADAGVLKHLLWPRVGPALGHQREQNHTATVPEPQGVEVSMQAKVFPRLCPCWINQSSNGP